MFSDLLFGAVLLVAAVGVFVAACCVIYVVGLITDTVSNIAKKK